MAVDGENENPSMGTFVLFLRLGGSEPPSGTISALGQAARPFRGWIDLMIAINGLRGWELREPPSGSNHA